MAGPKKRLTGERKRVTYILPANLDQNYELVAAYDRRTKSELIEEALVSWLKKRGIQNPTARIPPPWESKPE